MKFLDAQNLIAPYVDNGVNSGDSRIVARLNEAQRRLIDQYNFLVRREQLEAPKKVFVERAANSTNDLILDNYDATKVMVLAMWREENNELEMATALEKKALDMVERDLIQEVESARSQVTGEVGRLHNEIVTGLKVPTSRMTMLLNQAVSDAITHQKAFHAADDDDIPLPPVSYEIKKLLVESYLLSLNGDLELAGEVKTTAFQLIERDANASDRETRKNTRFALSLTDPDSFGYHWGRVGLAFEEALSFSDNAVKRAVTSAEEALMNMGKWVGTVGEYTLTISTSGEYILPREIETVLFVAFDGNPAPVHDRYMEYMRGGTGLKTTDNAWRTGFSDLGHVPDAADGNKIKRKYFITVPQEGKETVIHYLAKRRFVPHVSDTEPMFLRNYEAVSQAALSLLTQGQVGSLDVSKKLLTEQITQQFMKTQTWGVHNRPITNLR